MDTPPNTSFDAISTKPVDILLPIVTLKPISGFPQNIALEGLDTNVTVTLGIRDRLQRFQLTDNDRKLDSCEITFLDEEGLFTDPAQLIHGAIIDVAWGYPGAMSEERRLIVRRLKLGLMQGRKFARRRRGYLVTFTAIAPGITKHSVAPKTDDIFEGYALSTIVKIIATKLGYHTEANNNTKAIIEIPGEYDIIRSNVTRAATENYVQFLSRLANEYGLLFRQTSKGMFFGPRKVEDQATLIVDFDATLDGGYGLLLGFDLDGDLVFSVPAGLTVTAFRPSDQQIITTSIDNNVLQHKKGNTPSMAHTDQEATADTTPQTDTGLVQPPETTTVVAQYGVRTKSTLQAISKSRTVVEDFRPATAEKIIAVRSKHFNERIKRTWKLRLKLVGTVNVYAGGTIIIKNSSTALLEGLWYVIEARHTVDNSGYVTEITCRRQTNKQQSVASSQVITANVLTHGTKKNEPTEALSTALIASSPKFDNPTGKHHKPHDTTGDFFETRTRRGK